MAFLGISMHLFQKIYYQHVRNAVLDVCAKPVPVWGKRREMRWLLQGEKLSWHVLYQIFQSLSDFKLYAAVMHQSIPSANIPPGQPPMFCIYFQSRSRDLCHLNCLGVGPIIYYQSTKLSVNAVWRHFSSSNWSTIYCCSLVTKFVSKLGKTLKHWIWYLN